MPIIGCEFYLVDDRHHKSFSRAKGEKDRRYHQLMLAKNRTGYENISKLCSLGFTEGLYSKFPRVDKELIVKYHEGLIATSCCIGAEVPQLIMHGKLEEAEKALRWWLDIFGKDYYIEIQRHKGLENIDGLGISQEDINQNYASFDEYENAESNALLFCASKHREGSDIKNLDGCIFMDFVQNRYAKTFVQCIGRVLRKDKHNKKEFGLIIDIKAKSSTKIIDKMIHYLNIPANIFPWNYEYTIDKKSNIIINTLELLQEDSIKRKQTKEYEETTYDHSYTRQDLEKLFVRNIPKDSIYQQRVSIELELLERKQLIGYVLHALDILHLTKHMPHITRGSCGSSLVCYLLGISHVDPVKYNIKFSRFLNIYRHTLPDIDYDFPYNMRDEVFLKLHMKWPGKIARISNHVYYHEKSAKREALRNIGMKGFISKYEINDVIQSLPYPKKIELNRQIKELNKHTKELTN